jgi:hypothetical protein
MARNINELLDKLPAERRRKIEDRASTLLKKMELQELRLARRKTQSAVAARMKVAQSEISKIEQRSELRLSTLHDYVKALGGTLHMHAVFPEGSFEIQIK